MHTRLNFVLAGIVAILPPCLPAQVKPTEDQTIRRTYARLSFSTEITAVEGLSKVAKTEDLKAELTKKVPQFQIASIVAGPVSEIADKSWESMASHDAGDWIYITQSGMSGVDESTWTQAYEEGAAAKWADFHNAFLIDDRTVKQRLQQSGPTTANRYAQVDVMVTLAGKSRAYRSLFLFEPKGNVEVVDHVVGQGNDVTPFASKPVSTPLLTGSDIFVSNPVVRNWLQSKQILGCVGAECCDLPSMRCGISETSTKALAARPLHTPSRPYPPQPAGKAAAAINYGINECIPPDTNAKPVGENLKPVSEAAPIGSAQIMAGMNEAGQLTKLVDKHVTGSNYSAPAVQVGQGAVQTRQRLLRVQSKTAHLASVRYPLGSAGQEALSRFRLRRLGQHPALWGDMP